MKEAFIFLSLLIIGPKAPGNKIDVYLRSLISELKELQKIGILTYDSVSKINFRLHAMIMWTINDFSAYGNLFGWSTKGYLACPIYNCDSCSIRLKYGRKNIYKGHHRFLPSSYFQRIHQNRYFNGKSEIHWPPCIMSGDDILAQLEAIGSVKFGKVSKNRK